MGFVCVFVSSLGISKSFEVLEIQISLLEWEIKWHLLRQFQTSNFLTAFPNSCHFIQDKTLRIFATVCFLYHFSTFTFTYTVSN